MNSLPRELVQIFLVKHITEAQFVMRKRCAIAT
jgi:hypothetical protein